MAKKTEKDDRFSFEISLSILNNLGRTLYRSFVTVIGEAISNAWDADAHNVWIYINKEKNSFLIKDDGIGMSKNDFQNKFLKIGYSKRKDGPKSEGGRPYIGRKGIGKLALLSCADKISVISKILGGSYVGGVIDNSGLEEAITKELTPEKYKLEKVDFTLFGEHTKNHKRGTIIYFENVKEGINHSSEYLKKIIALYFRFSLLDKKFNIFIDDEKITLKQLVGLAKETEFLWNINELNDPYINKYLKNLKEPVKNIVMEGNIKGFVASVSKPSDLKITTTDERAGVDLFTNGRLRERDILKHIPTARIAENYFYGQIHFNELDDEKDRFATGREGIIADDPKYKDFLDNLRKKILAMVTDWDKWRGEHREDGDPENERISKKERASLNLYHAVLKDYDIPDDSENGKRVNGWVDGLSDDAKFNFESYAECFVSENLVRKYIQEKSISLSPEAKKLINDLKKAETNNKKKGNISIQIRKTKNELGYLSMSDLACLVDKKDPQKEACLARDANEYKPMRDALAHTALLTDVAKRRLTSVYENIQGRIKDILS